MGSDLSIVLQTCVNAPDSIVENHRRIIAGIRKSIHGAAYSAVSDGARGTSYTFEDDPMNYAELRLMTTAEARGFVARGGDRRTIAGAGGNRVLMLEPSCSTNSMSGISSDTAGMAARAQGYGELRAALADPLLAGRVGIAIDASVKLGNRIPAQSGRFTQCASLLLANILLCVEGGVKDTKTTRDVLPPVAFYVLDLRGNELDNESGPWVVNDLMERVRRVYRYHAGLRRRQRQQNRLHSLFPGAAALASYDAAQVLSDDDDDDAAQREVSIHMPVFSKDTRGDLFCCSLQHVLMTDNCIEIGGILRTVHTLLESVMPKGYAPPKEDWMLLPYLCLIDLQKQDVLPSQIRQFLLEYTPPTRQVVVACSGRPEEEWKSTKEQEKLGSAGGARRISPTAFARSASRGRAKPEDFTEVYLLQDRGPSLASAATTRGGAAPPLITAAPTASAEAAAAAPTAPTTAPAAAAAAATPAPTPRIAMSSDGSESAGSISFRTDSGRAESGQAEAADNEINGAPPPSAKPVLEQLHEMYRARPDRRRFEPEERSTPYRTASVSSLSRPAAVTRSSAPPQPYEQPYEQQQQQKRLRDEAAAFLDRQQALRRQSPPPSPPPPPPAPGQPAPGPMARQPPWADRHNGEANEEDDDLQRRIQEEEVKLREEQQKLDALRRQQEQRRRPDPREERLRQLQEQRRALQQQQQALRAEENREASRTNAILRPSERQRLPQDRQVVTKRELPSRPTSTDPKDIQARLQQLFEQEQAIYREYDALKGKQAELDEENLPDGQRSEQEENSTSQEASGEPRSWQHAERAAYTAPSAISRPQRSAVPRSISSRRSGIPRGTASSVTANRRGRPTATSTGSVEMRLPGEHSIDPARHSVAPPPESSGTPDASIATTDRSSPSPADPPEAAAAKTPSRSSSQPTVRIVKPMPPAIAEASKRANSRPRQQSAETLVSDMSSPAPDLYAPERDVVAGTPLPSEDADKDEQAPPAPQPIFSVDEEAEEPSLSPVSSLEPSPAPADTVGPHPHVPPLSFEDPRIVRPVPVRRPTAPAASPSLPPPSPSSQASSEQIVDAALENSEPPAPAAAADLEEKEASEQPESDAPGDEPEDAPPYQTDEDDAEEEEGEEREEEPPQAGPAAEDAISEPEEPPAAVTPPAPRGRPPTIQRHAAPQPSPTASGRDTPFHDPGMHSLSPTGPLSGRAAAPSESARQPAERPSALEELERVKAAQAAAANNHPRRRTRSARALMRQGQQQQQQPLSARSHYHPPTPYTQLPEEIITDPRDVGAPEKSEVNERRADRARRFRDKRYDDVPSRFRSRRAVSRDVSAPAEGDAAMDDALEPAAAQRQLRQTSPHPGVSSTSRRTSRSPTSRARPQPPPPQQQPAASTQETDELEHLFAAKKPAAPTPAAPAPAARGSTAAAKPRPSTAKTPYETASSRARRSTSREVRRRNDAKQRHETPHQPHINRRSSAVSPRIDTGGVRGGGDGGSSALWSARGPQEHSNKSHSAAAAEEPALVLTPKEASQLVDSRHGSRAQSPLERSFNVLSSEHKSAASSLASASLRRQSPDGSSHAAGQREKPVIDAPPGWTMPMVNSKLRTLRPSQR